MSQIKVTSVAQGIPFDPDLPSQNPTSGYALIWNSTLQLWQAANIFSGGGSGVTPPFVFSKDGNVTVGTALRTGVVPTNLTGQMIDGSNQIVKLGVSNSVAVGSITRIQITRRTGLATFVDVANAYIDIPAGGYATTRTGISVPIGPDWEIGCYNKSGSSLSNVVFMVYLLPA